MLMSNMAFVVVNINFRNEMLLQQFKIKIVLCLLAIQVLLVVLIRSIYLLNWKLLVMKTCKRSSDTYITLPQAYMKELF